MMNQQRIPARLAHRHGFTLIELLVAVVIIGIIAGMVLYTIAGAQRDAKEAKTKATLRKLNSVILQKFEEYKYRSVKINIPKYFTQRNFGMTSAMTTEQAPPLLLAKEMARIRAIVLKDYMRMEMPDQQLDLFCVPTRVNNISLTNGTTVTLDDFGGRYCAPEYNLLRRYFNLTIVADPFMVPRLSRVRSIIGQEKLILRLMHLVRGLKSGSPPNASMQSLPIR